MSLTYLKESEAGYPDIVLPGHCTGMPQRKFNVRATFTPTASSNVPSEHHLPATQPIGTPKHSLVTGYEQSRQALHPLYRTTPGVSNSRLGLYASADAASLMRRAAESQPSCGCPSRRINVMNLAPSLFNLFLEVLASIGDLEQKPGYDAESNLSLQFYDLRAAQKLTQVLPTISVLSGVKLHHVPLESDVCVLIDIPWGQDMKHDDLLGPLEQYGPVATLSFGKALIGGPQQVVCLYHDVRDTTKALNKLISVNNVQLPVRLMSIPHSHTCPAAVPGAHKPHKSSFSGIGMGPLETASMPAPFASSSNSSLTSITSPYSSSLSDMSSTYFSGQDSPWASSKPSSTDLGKSQSEQSLKRLNPQLVGMAGNLPPPGVAGSDTDVAKDMASMRAPGTISMLDSSNADLNGSVYGSIRSTTASTAAPAGASVFDSILNNGRFGSLSTAHDPVGLRLHSSPLLSSLASSDRADPTSSSSAKSESPVSRQTIKSSELSRSANVGKRFATPDAKPDLKESNQKHADRERGNDIDLDAIAGGSETRTTVMLRNIPNKLDFKDLKRFLDATNRCTYDFLYLRFDFMNRCNVGYAFISFTKPKHVATFVKARAGMKWSQYNYNSEKVIEIKFARIQGRDSLIQKFRNSPVMSQDPAFKPRLYYTKGRLSGKEEPFPDPTTSKSST